MIWTRLPDAEALAQATAKLAGDVLSGLPMLEIIGNQMKALGDNLAAKHGDGGANEPLAVEKHQLEQRVAIIRDLIELFPPESVDKNDRLWQLLFHTLDKIVDVTKQVRRQNKVSRALGFGAKDIKEGFAKMDGELTTRIEDVTRKLDAEDREKAAAFRRRMAE